MALLTCENLSLGYEGHEIVHGLDFEVNAGDYLCIVGENGSGKSTLMKTVLGLQPPLGGKVRTGDGLARNEIGYLPQQTVVQKDFPASVREIVLSGCQNLGTPRKIYVSILLSVFTLGGYLIYWKYNLLKNVKTVTSHARRIRTELLLMLFVPFYALYWWYTRGNAVHHALAGQGYPKARRGKTYLLLSCFGLEIICAALMQRDFNTFAASVDSQLAEAVRQNNITKQHYFYGAEARTLAKKNMEKMGIAHLARRCYRELSGGQQQRVLLARALCATKQMILLDEPVSGLDPKVTAEMYELILNLNQAGVTVVMISHDIAAAVRYASHILHIGNSVFFGTKDAYLATELSDSFWKGGDAE